MTKKFSGIFSATNTLKLLSFMVEEPGREYPAGEIMNKTGLSRRGFYLASAELEKAGLIRAKKGGRFSSYSSAYDNPVAKQFKVLANVKNITCLVQKLKHAAISIILFGSAARGENGRDSDIDLFIETPAPQDARKIVENFKKKHKIQAVVKAPSEKADMARTDKVFYDEVKRGIVLWERET